jgi:hypothetical protein
VFEAGLIIGIVLAVTGQVPHRNRWIGGGVAAGALGACVVAAARSRCSYTASPPATAART